MNRGNDDLRRIVFSLKHADLFLTALSEALDVQLSKVFTNRRQILAKHAEIMYIWLEESELPLKFSSP